MHKAKQCVVNLAIISLISLSGCSQKNSAPEPAVNATPTVVEKTFTKKIEQLNHEEAGEAREYYKALGKKRQQAKSLERMISLSADHQEIDGLLLELANVTYELELFPEAEAMYHQHSVLYPGNQNVDYVKARQIESSFRQVLDASRDQSKTTKTIKLSEKFLAQFGDNNSYSKRVKKIMHECYHIQLESEIHGAAFYVQKYVYAPFPGTLGAARSRLVHAQKKTLPYITTKQAQSLSKAIEELNEVEREKLTPEMLQDIIEKAYTMIEDFRGTNTLEYLRNSIWNRF